MSRSDDPRRLLRRGSCAFSTIFKLFNEGTFVARLFLTAALYQPVMQLLVEDEWFYDIDPERTLHRFPPAERLQRFGTPGSKEYDQETRQYRERITSKLVSLVDQFIVSLQVCIFFLNFGLFSLKYQQIAVKTSCRIVHCIAYCTCTAMFAMCLSFISQSINSNCLFI